MPVGTVTKNTERFDLKTLTDGFVVIRRMSYGEKLERQDEMLKMKTTTGESVLELSMLIKKTALRDFGNLVIDHNITDEAERKLNFKNPQDVLSLDPRIGDEISGLIDKINAFEEQPEVKNL
jgi:hypothetical protein